MTSSKKCVMATRYLRSSRRLLLSLCLLSSLSLPARADTLPAETAAQVEARRTSEEKEREVLSRQLWDWYGQASDLHDAGKLSEAWALYQRVWRYRKTYDVATSLGGVCFQREEYALAAHYYRIALDEMVPTASPSLVAEVEAAFEKSQARATALRVAIKASEGKVASPVTITDVQANVVVEAPYYLEPGDRELEARTPGRPAVTRRLRAKPGQTVEWEIDFGANEPARPRETPQLSTVRTTTVRHPWIVFPIGGLLTGALGYGTWVNAARGADAYDSTRNLSLSPGACSGAAPAAACDRAADLRQQARDAETRAWLFGGGAALTAVATGIVYWLWETEVPVEVGFDPAGSRSEMRWSYEF